MRSFHQGFALFLFALSVSISAFAMQKTDLLLPTYECTLTNQRSHYDMANTGKNQFMTYTPEIFLICQSDTVVKGDNLRAVWIADNAEKPGWDNYKIAERKSVVRSDLNGLDMYRTVFSIKKPMNGWPTGSYHVRIYLNGTEGYRYDFVVR